MKRMDVYVSAFFGFIVLSLKEVKVQNSGGIFLTGIIG